MSLEKWKRFFFIGPFIILLGFALGGWAIAGASVLVSIGLLIAWLVKFAFYPVGVFAHLSALFFCLGGLGISFLAFLCMLKLTRFFIQTTRSSLQGRNDRS